MSNTENIRLTLVSKSERLGPSADVQWYVARTACTVGPPAAHELARTFI